MFPKILTSSEEDQDEIATPRVDTIPCRIGCYDELTKYATVEKLMLQSGDLNGGFERINVPIHPLLL
jgi:hypothetical protein